MLLLLSLFTTFISSFATILYKKSVVSAGNVSNIIFYYVGLLGGVIVSILLVVFGYFDYGLLKNRYILGLMFLLIFQGILLLEISQSLFKTEKMSVITVNEQISKIIMIIAAFFIFKNSSVASLIIAIITIIVVMLTKIDLKKAALPRNTKYLIIYQLRLIFENLFIAYLLTLINTSDLYVLMRFESLILGMIFILFLKKLSDFKQDKTFYKARLTPSFIGSISSLLTFFVLKSMGLVVSTLLSFLGVVVTLIMSYIYFNDKPTKKDLFLAFFVSVMVGLGYYFK